MRFAHGRFELKKVAIAEQQREQSDSIMTPIKKLDPDVYTSLYSRTMCTSQDPTNVCTSLDTTNMFTSRGTTKQCYF